MSRATLSSAGYHFNPTTPTFSTSLEKDSCGRQQLIVKHFKEKPPLLTTICSSSDNLNADFSVESPGRESST